MYGLANFVTVSRTAWPTKILPLPLTQVNGLGPGPREPYAMDDKPNVSFFENLPDEDNCPMGPPRSVSKHMSQTAAARGRASLAGIIGSRRESMRSPAIDSLPSPVQTGPSMHASESELESASDPELELASGGAALNSGLPATTGLPIITRPRPNIVVGLTRGDEFCPAVLNFINTLSVDYEVTVDPQKSIGPLLRVSGLRA
ncbi:uncharacterized protein BDZ99DRAFT_519530 [Mytilinidion resinicola]|uniref:Uncharacterized protein n=1 Tax=Mytilinidion resinicola TaxID=574789 RepID=A0A6A6YPP5_9PEZI|nr:uncharacterized protein BDZ99DRAFT_519530 [Mytilinidion resinicola]KAF2810852.1 hypothetical protein BDZ99DRAFT_519530 [Mytilinidion resinicola]